MNRFHKLSVMTLAAVTFVLVLILSVLPTSAQGFIIIPDPTCDAAITTDIGDLWFIEYVTVSWNVTSDARDVVGCETVTIDFFTDSYPVSCEYVTSDGLHALGSATIRVFTYDQIEAEILKLHGEGVYNQGQETSMHATKTVAETAFDEGNFEAAAGATDGLYHQIMAITPNGVFVPYFDLLKYVPGELRGAAGITSTCPVS